MAALGDAGLLPVGQLAALLQAYQDQLRRLARHVDTDWLGNAPAAPERAQLGLAPVAPAAFTVPAHRLALLEKPQLLAMLAARALYAHRVALCRCVDGTVLARLRAMIGAHALSVLRDAGADADAPDLSGSPLPAHATLPAWAADGYRHFARDGVWSEPSLQRLIQLALPAAATEGGHGIAAPRDSDALIALLPTLFPESAWLFG